MVDREPDVYFAYNRKTDWIWRELTTYAKAQFRPNACEHVRSTCLSPQLEANRLHPVGRLCAFVVGVEPPP